MENNSKSNSLPSVTAHQVRTKGLNFGLSFLIFENRIPVEEVENFTYEELLEMRNRSERDDLKQEILRHIDLRQKAFGLSV